MPPTGLPARSVFGASSHSCEGDAATGQKCDHDQHIVIFGGEVDPSTQGHAGAGDFTDELWCVDVQQRVSGGGNGRGQLGVLQTEAEHVHVQGICIRYMHVNACKLKQEWSLAEQTLALGA